MLIKALTYEARNDVKSALISADYNLSVFGDFNKQILMYSLHTGGDSHVGRHVDSYKTRKEERS